MLGEEQAGGEEEHSPDEARAIEEREREHIPIGTATRLEVNHPKWTGELPGETIYVYTLK